MLEDMSEWFELAPETQTLTPLVAVQFRLTSPAFSDLGRLPERYGRRGANVSPPLAWSEPPMATRELAVVLEERTGVRWLDEAFAFAEGGDPTVRWLGWGLAPGAARLEEGEQPPILGTNDLGVAGYSGPEEARTSGFGSRVSRAVRFSVLALDAPLVLAAGADRAEFEAKTQGHVVASATMLARYERDTGLKAILRRH
jgi:phosphatidylethanolamine-binding protein (PEBP) family uncharacterized protein